MAPNNPPFGASTCHGSRLTFCALHVLAANTDTTIVMVLNYTSNGISARTLQCESQFNPGT